MNMLLKYGKTTAFFAGALSHFGFAPSYIFPAAIIGFSALFFLLLNAKSGKKAFGLGYCFGFAHFAFGLSWIGNALLIEPDKFGWLYPFVLIACGGFFGLFYAFPALISYYANKPWQKWLSFCAATIIFEWIRSFIFTGFPWNLSGYMLAFSNNLIQAASLGGTYLLSLAVVSCCSIGGLWFNDRRLKNFIMILGIIIGDLAALWLFGWWRLSVDHEVKNDIVLRIVQPSIPQTLKWNAEAKESNFQTYLRMSAAPAQIKPKFIIWGETASPFMLDSDDTRRQQAAEILAAGSYLIAGMITYQPKDGWYVPHNSMAVIDEHGNIAALYHKTHLVPFGEYIPFRQYLPDFIRPIANVIGTFGQGNGPQKIALPKLPSFSGAICYEIIFPHQIIKQSDRPDFLINLTNDGWYGDSAGPYQHWVAAKLRAIEEGLTVVRAANNGISGLITAFGKEKGVLKLNETGISDIRFNQPILPPTIYSRFGNGPIITFCLILLFLGVIKIEKISLFSQKEK